MKTRSRKHVLVKKGVVPPGLAHGGLASCLRSGIGVLWKSGRGKI